MTQQKFKPIPSKLPPKVTEPVAAEPAAEPDPPPPPPVLHPRTLKEMEVGRARLAELTPKA